MEVKEQIYLATQTKSAHLENLTTTPVKKAKVKGIIKSKNFAIASLVGWKSRGRDPAAAAAFCLFEQIQDP